MSRETRIEKLEERLAGLAADQQGTREHVDLLNELAGEILFNQPGRAFELAEDAEALSVELDYERGLANSRTNQDSTATAPGGTSRRSSWRGKPLSSFARRTTRRARRTP